MTRPHDLNVPHHHFRRMVAVRKVGDSGLVQSVDASEEERRKIAAFLDIIDVTHLSCTFNITRWRARGIKLAGSLQACVVQACVVTLEPVEETVEATFERRFLPADMLDGGDDADEVFVDPEGEDPPEPLTSEIDLGEIAVEELALNLNPYPRKEGSAFAGSDTDPAEAAQREKEKPFAALAKLKLKPQEKP